MRCLLQGVLGVTLLVSCTDTGILPTDQNPVAQAAKPSTRAEQILDFVAVTFWDPRVSIAGIVGFAAEVTPADLCANRFAFTNTFAHIVLTPSGGFLAGAAGGRDAPVQLFEFEGDLTSHCDLVGATLIATGTATFRAPFAATPGGAFAGTFILRGIVDLTSGGQRAWLSKTTRLCDRTERSRELRQPSS